MSMHKRTKQERRHQRRRRVQLSGTAACPRASVYRSLRTIAVQLIDDERGHTLVAVSSGSLREASDSSLTKMQQAEAVGRQVSERARASGIEQVVFDRGGFRYHGRVRALAEAMRAGGLQF